jgi:substrate import-associated zinc metallohydrolase lipoprotein
MILKDRNLIGGAKRFRRLMCVFLFAVSLNACQTEDEELDVSFLDPAPGQKTALDLWLEENFITPFNIAVDYKWTPYEVAANKVLVPPKESQIKPVMEMVKKTWIDPYQELAGEAFMKEYAPKQFVLVGSAQYNDDGTFVLGEAESGRKITLFVINDFDSKNVPAVKQMLQTIHHEFAHILHQTVLYPREYKQITPSGYTASWYNTSMQNALDLGFISPYARSSSDEDFVEMIATMLVEGQEGFDELVSHASPTGQTKLRQKEAIVVAYFQDTWHMDFYALQAKTTTAIEKATCGC